jgi:glutaminyl-peptide cyclotransferase
LLVALSGCDDKRDSARQPQTRPDKEAVVTKWLPWKKEPPAASAPTPPVPPREIWKQFSGEKAFAHVRFQTELGPRPAGSPEIERLREYITQHVTAAGWQVQRQPFSDQTPRGPLQFTNLIARFQPDPARPATADTQKVIVASHYDTKLFDTIRFVGASDGASSTGALIELARVLALDWELAKCVELVFFDGEEAISQFSATDGLYGSRHYAKELRESGRNAQFKAGVLWDMIGDRDLTITLSPDSPAEVARAILESAAALGVRDRFRYHAMPIWDDHVPLNQAGIPTIDLIDFDYQAWHTADDTLERLSPESIEKVAAVTLHYLRRILP